MEDLELLRGGKRYSRSSSRMGRILGSHQEGQVCASVWLLWGIGKDEANQGSQGCAWSAQMCRFYPWSGRAVVTSRMYKTLVVAGWQRDLFRSRERKNWESEGPNSPEVMPHNTLYYFFQETSKWTRMLSMFSFCKNRIRLLWWIWDNTEGSLELFTHWFVHAF